MCDTPLTDKQMVGIKNCHFILQIAQKKDSYYVVESSEDDLIGRSLSTEL
jgi:hypothetical protein